jgi:glycosyltransferase involved in cell wall biosynthesis
VSSGNLVRACILVPTYDNARTVRDVVERALGTGLDVLVVDDGSRDGTPEILASLEGIAVHRHERNLGKGAALKSGFRLAEERGYTHAITLDSDGQHFPEDAPVLLAAVRAWPEALIVGARDLAAACAGRGSRFGRRFSNFWTYVETGERVADTQSGFRVYPLQAVRALALANDGFGFEIEVLVKAAWTGVPLVSVPVRVFYPPEGERVSHFRPIADFASISRLNTHLVFLRIALPAPFLALISRRSFQELSLRERLSSGTRNLLLEGHGSPLRVAGSVALGLFMGIAPVWGFQVALTLALAHVLGASKPIAVVAAHVSFPALVPAILYASLVLGRRLVGHGSGAATELQLERADFLCWVIGSFALASALAALGFALTLVCMTAARKAGKWRTG